MICITYNRVSIAIMPLYLKLSIWPMTDDSGEGYLEMLRQSESERAETHQNVGHQCHIGTKLFSDEFLAFKK